MPNFGRGGCVTLVPLSSPLGQTDFLVAGPPSPAWPPLRARKAPCTPEGYCHKTFLGLTFDHLAMLSFVPFLSLFTAVDPVYRGFLV